MAKIKKAQTGRKLTPARTRQVADSLERVGKTKIGLALEKYGRMSEVDKKGKDEEGRSPREARKSASDLWSAGETDKANAKRYKSLADKAEGKMKKGGKVMLKRKDGSVSQRGLWDNIRANKGSGKKPTAAMLKQEKKIKAKGK